MNKHLPKISFESQVELDIEIMSFEETYNRLSQITDHNPFSPHRIQFYCIIVVSEGSYKHFLDFKQYTLQNGSVLFISKNQIHHFTKKLQNVNGFSICLNSKFVENKYFQSEKFKLNRLFNYYFESPVIHQRDIGEDDFIGIARRMYFELHYPNSIAKSEILRAMLHILLLKSERIKNEQTIRGIKPYWIEKFNAFKDLLQKEYSNTRSSRIYASKLFISYKLLNEIVKKLTNKTVKAFIDSYVTLEIKRYLISTSLSIKEISPVTGFEESAHLINFFKKHTGMTPLKFRQQP